MNYSFKYNYLIIGDGGYYLVGYRDIISLSNVRYFTDYYTGFNSRLARNLVRWNFSRVVNRFVKTPFKGFVYPRLFPHSFNDNKPICYLFFGCRPYIYNSSYLDYIKQQDSRTKCVLYMQDLVARNKYLNIEKIRDKMDLLLSYDKGDCDKYGMHFYSTPMSRIPNLIIEDIQKESDFYFCGKAKERYEIVHQLFNELTLLGYKCDFNILGTPSNAEHISGINYLSKPLDYEENLQHVAKTRCVVEIMQEGADGFTPRLWESILYDKHLLSNNMVLRDSHYYELRYIHFLEECFVDHDYSWITSTAKYSDEIKESLSPINLLKFVDSHL